jgi:ATP-dependent exoDNAse (exonuclease V) alpha subunit
MQPRPSNEGATVIHEIVVMAVAIQVIPEAPYRLARDIRGIGFKTADAIAMKIGIEKIAMVRVRAGPIRLV